MKLISSIVPLLFIIPTCNQALANDQPFCPGKHCTVWWDGFNASSVYPYTHDGNATCNASESISWGQDHQLTIKYSRVAGHQAKTCYIHTNQAIRDLNPASGGKLPLHGYITADIKMDGGAGQYDYNIWPAYWLDKREGWPYNGEIDIAERQGGTTQTHLIGDPNNPFDGSHLVGYATYGNGLAPSTGVHHYGFEWQYDSSRQHVTFTTYFDGKPAGQQSSYTLSANPPASSHATTIRNVFNGFPNMGLVFDTDDHGSTDLNYSMTISNVKIYSVDGSQPPSTCPLPTGEDFNAYVDTTYQPNGQSVITSSTTADPNVKYYDVSSPYTGHDFGQLNLNASNTIYDPIKQASATGHYTYSIVAHCKDGSASPAYSLDVGPKAPPSKSTYHIDCVIGDVKGVSFSLHKADGSNQALSIGANTIDAKKGAKIVQTGTSISYPVDTLHKGPYPSGLLINSVQSQ